MLKEAKDKAKRLVQDFDWSRAGVRYDLEKHSLVVQVPVTGRSWKH